MSAVSAAAEEESFPKVILFSWDGAAYWMTSRLLSDGHLPNLQRLIKEGMWSDGMITSFPSKTAAGHAMIWTGTYGHTSGITGNSILLEPASEHDRLENRSGYFSDALKAEPLWVMTARAGLQTYTFHATQSYPFDKHLDALSPAARGNLNMLYGYTRINVPPAVYSSSATKTAPASGWAAPEASVEGAREFRFDVGDGSFWGLFYDDPLDPIQGCDTLAVVENKQDEVFVTRIKPEGAEKYSAPVETSHEGEPIWFSLILLELDASASDFMVYRSSAEAVVQSSDDFPGAGEWEVEAFAGNGGSGLYRRGDFGLPLYEGGDGQAEERYLETVARLADQIRLQVEPTVIRSDFRLLIMYTPAPDEAAHTFAGYLDPLILGYDDILAEKLWPVLARAFEVEDRLLGWVMDQAEATKAHVVLVSDHGMAGTRRLFHVNVALERAGLLTLTSERRVDLSRTRALLLPTADASVAINTVDRKGGIVPVEDREKVIDEVKKVLSELVDPETDQRIVSGFYEPSLKGLLQPGGETTGDLFLDLAPGYYFSFATNGEELVSMTAPAGNHIFLPTRRDMLAIFGAWGPQIPAGRKLHRVRGIDVVPTILDILDIEGSDGSSGTSLLPQSTLIEILSSKRK